MSKQIRRRKADSELFYPIMLKQMTDEQTKGYHIQKFAQWRKRCEQQQKGELVFGVDRNVYHDVELLAEEPNEEEDWVIHKMKAPQPAWERWFVGQYFTEEQKNKLRLTEKDIAGKGMR